LGIGEERSITSEESETEDLSDWSLVY
jgi:hypothetical protein